MKQAEMEQRFEYAANIRDAMAFIKEANRIAESIDASLVVTERVQ